MPSISARHYELAEGLMGAGTGLADLHERLKQEGLDEEQAAEVACKAFLATMVREAALRMSMGEDERVIRHQLLESSLSESMVDTVMRAAVATYSEAKSKAQSGPTFAATTTTRESGGVQVVAFVVLMVGALLAAGNITGAFPTFPLAGFITLAVGVLIARAGSRR
jgi:hypothetical protein